MNLSNQTIRMNILLPQELVRKLKKVTPKRGISKFLTQAAQEKIARLEKQRALEELLEAPPSFTTIDDATSYVTNLRDDTTRLPALDL